MQENTREQPPEEIDQRVVSTVNASNKGGRPTLYTPETVDKLLYALADGLTIKQACLASGISESTLSDWRERYPDLEPRLTQARETARQKALASIKGAGARDWKAHEAWLRLSFQADYRQPNTKIDVNTNAQAGAIVISEEKKRELREKLEAYRRRQNGEA